MLKIQSFVACAVEMNLAWNFTGTECLTLYYDSVEKLGRLACFKCLFFRFEQSDFRTEYVAFTLLTSGNAKSDKSLKRFRARGGVLPYLGYTGTCRWIGYGFWPRCPKQGIQFDLLLS